MLALDSWWCGQVWRGSRGLVRPFRQPAPFMCVCGAPPSEYIERREQQPTPLSLFFCGGGAAADAPFSIAPRAGHEAQPPPRPPSRAFDTNAPSSGPTARARARRLGCRARGSTCERGCSRRRQRRGLFVVFFVACPFSFLEHAHTHDCVVIVSCKGEES